MVLVSTVLFMPVIRTYIVTHKSVLISVIHNIFYAGYKNIICSSDDVLITGIHCNTIGAIPIQNTHISDSEDSGDDNVEQNTNSPAHSCGKAE